MPINRQPRTPPQPKPDQSLAVMAAAFATETAALKEQLGAAQAERDQLAADLTAAQEAAQRESDEAATERSDNRRRVDNLRSALAESQAETAKQVELKAVEQNRADAAEYAAGQAAGELSSFKLVVIAELSPVLGRHGIDAAGKPAEEILRLASHLLDVRRDAPIEALRKQLNHAQRRMRRGDVE